MRIFVLFFVLTTFTACSQQPKPLKYGKDECSACKMTLLDKKFGAEIITNKGKIYKFDDLVCMVGFLKGNESITKEISKKLVTDYQKENSFIDAEKAFYFTSEDLHSPMNGNAAAFLTKEEALKFQNGKQGVIMDWSGVYTKLK